jgi:sugar phosphate isomerase/epimerase
MNCGFSIGTTSFIYPAGWSENVERLAGSFQDIELLLFDAEALPDRAELEALATLKHRTTLSYTVHTPLDVDLSSADENTRRASVERVLRAIDLTRGLSPLGWTVHVVETPNPQTARRSLVEILERGVAAEQLCVETLDYDIAPLVPVIDELGLSVTLDVGHHQRDGRSVAESLDLIGDRVRIIHWHGVTPDGRDHRSLRHYPRDEALGLVRALLARRFDGVLTLEVFNRDDLDESRAILDQLLAEASA